MSELSNIVPKMTSNTTPSGVVRASSFYDSRYAPYKAFDGDINTELGGWATANGTSTGWIEYEFPDKTRVSSYAIVSRVRSGSKESPEHWKLLGSNDGMDYTLIDEVNGEMGWSSYEKRLFELPNSVNFKVYRLEVLKNEGLPNYTVLQEFELFYEYSDKILLLSEDERYIASHTVTGEVPKMSSNISPLGQVSTSNNSGNAWRVFNKTSAGSWNSGWNGSAGDWLSYEFEIPVSVYKYTIQSASNYLNEAPNHFMLEGSNDGVSWVSLHEKESSPSWSARETREYVVRKSIVGEYKSYRLRFLSTKGSSTLSVPRINFLYKDSWMTEKPDGSEQDFINRGMSPQELSDLDFSSEFTGKHYIQDVSTVLGSGKVFEQDLDVDKVIKKLTIKWEFYESTIDNKFLILNDSSYKKWDGSWQIVTTSTPTAQDYINNGMEGSDIEAIPESAWAELQALGEIKILYYTDSSFTEEITIETKTEPYTIYDEFGDSMEVLYYTDDPDKEDAELHIIANYSPLDEFDDFSVVTWTDNTENPLLKIDFEKEPKQICVQTDTLSISSLTTSIVYTGSPDIKVLISFDNGLIYRHPVTFEEVTIPDYIDSEKEPINITQYKQEEINTLYNQAGALKDLNTSDFLEKAIQEGSFKGLFILGEEDAFLDKIEITTASEVKSSPTVKLYEMEYYVVKE